MCWRISLQSVRNQDRFKLPTDYSIEEHEHERWHDEVHGIAYLEEILDWLEASS